MCLDLQRVALVSLPYVGQEGEPQLESSDVDPRALCLGLIHLQVRGEAGPQHSERHVRAVTSGDQLVTSSFSGYCVMGTRYPAPSSTQKIE